MGFLRDFGTKLSSAMKTIFADDPEQYVEETEGANLTKIAAIGLKDGTIKQEDAVELIKAQRKNNEKAELTSKRIERSVQLTPSDKTDFRNDSTMDRAQSVDVKSTPASELENHKRAPGGRERDDKTK